MSLHCKPRIVLIRGSRIWCEAGGFCLQSAQHGEGCHAQIALHISTKLIKVLIRTLTTTPTGQLPPNLAQDSFFSDQAASCQPPTCHPKWKTQTKTTRLIIVNRSPYQRESAPNTPYRINWLTASFSPIPTKFKNPVCQPWKTRQQDIWSWGENYISQQAVEEDRRLLLCWWELISGIQLNHRRLYSMACCAKLLWERLYQYTVYWIICRWVL